MMVLFFGAIAVMEREEIRRRRSKIHQWWPLAVARLVVVIVYLLVLGWVTVRFSLEWRTGELIVAMLIGLGIWEFVQRRFAKS
jgi:hypothetical protein